MFEMVFPRYFTNIRFSICLCSNNDLLESILRVSFFRHCKSSSSKTEFFVYTFSRNSPLIYYQEGNRKALISWSSEEVNGQTLNPTLTWDVGLAAITRRPVLRKMTRWSEDKLWASWRKGVKFLGIMGRSLYRIQNDEHLIYWEGSVMA